MKRWWFAGELCVIMTAWGFVAAKLSPVGHLVTWPVAACFAAIVAALAVLLALSHRSTTIRRAYGIVVYLVGGLGMFLCYNDFSAFLPTWLKALELGLYTLVSVGGLRMALSSSRLAPQAIQDPMRRWWYGGELFAATDAAQTMGAAFRSTLGSAPWDEALVNAAVMLMVLALLAFAYRSTWARRLLGVLLVVIGCLGVWYKIHGSVAAFHVVPKVFDTACNLFFVVTGARMLLLPKLPANRSAKRSTVRT